LDISIDFRYYPRNFINLIINFAYFCFRFVLFITTGGMMKDPSGTKQEPIEEVSILKLRIQELEEADAERKRMNEVLRERQRA
jgi:hypothetical protein